MNGKLRYPIYALCGLLMALPYCINSLWVLAWLAFIPVLILEFSFDNRYKHSYLSAYRRGFSFFYPYGIVVFIWFFEMYPLDFTGMTRGAALCVVILGVFGLSLLQTVVWAFFFVIIHFVRSRLNQSADVLCLFTVPFVWVALEWMQNLTWAGVPWGKLALGQVKMRQIIQSSSLFGPYFVSFLIVLFASLAAFAFLSLKRREKRSKTILCSILALILFSANFVYGAVRISGYEPQGERVKVAAIQGNIDSKEKWSSDLDLTLDTYKELTKSAAEDGAKMVLWPETAIPVRVLNNPDIRSEIEDLSEDTGAVIFVGAFNESAEGVLENAIFEVDPQEGFTGEHYIKRRLVPFGEFVPWRSFIMTVVPPLNELTIIGDDLAAGEGAQLIETEYGKIGSIICFDSIYEALARESAASGAQVLFVSTNDSWFGDSSAVYEHNSHSILRAVENGKYVVRAANTGISSVITPTGEVVSTLDPMVKGYLSEEIVMIPSSTLYSNTGDVIVYISFAAIAISIAVSIVFKRRNGVGNPDRQVERG